MFFGSVLNFKCHRDEQSATCPLCDFSICAWPDPPCAEEDDNCGDCEHETACLRLYDDLRTESASMLLSQSDRFGTTNETSDNKYVALSEGILVVFSSLAILLVCCLLFVFFGLIF